MRTANVDGAIPPSCRGHRGTPLVMCRPLRGVHAGARSTTAAGTEE